MERVLYSSRDYTMATEDSEMYSAYEDYLDGNALTKEDISFDDWLVEESDHDYTYIKDVLDLSLADPCVFVGTVGTWRGRLGVESAVFDSVLDAVEACMGRSIEDIDISFDSGHIDVVAYHHDGRNYYSIYLLNDAGIAAAEELEDGNVDIDLSDAQYHKDMPDNLF